MSVFMQYYVSRVSQVHTEGDNAEEVTAVETPAEEPKAEETAQVTETVVTEPAAPEAPAATEPAATEGTLEEITEDVPEQTPAEEMVQLANDTEKLAESKETAEEVVEAVETDAKAAADIAEKQPDQVEASDVVLATEMFNSKAARLGVKLEDLGVKIDIEAIKTHPAQELKNLSNKMFAFAKIARESINHMKIDIENNMDAMWYGAEQAVLNQSFTVKQEYNTIDWPKSLLGGIVTGLWRKIVKGGETTIEAPGALVNLFLGKWTVVGDALEYVSTLNTVTGAAGLAAAAGKAAAPAVASAAARAGTAGVSGSKSHAGLAGAFRKDGQLKKAENAYYLLVTNNKVDANVPKKYAAIVSEFGKSISALKSGVCKKCPKRKLALGELNDLKLFRPDRIKPEIDSEAQNTIKKCKGNAELIKQWEEIYNKLSQISLGVVKYLTDNLHGYDYTEGETVAKK